MSDEIVYLTLEQVISLHRRAIEVHGGTHGIRDRGALESAVAQACATFDGVEFHAGPANKAAAYLYHLARNHAFLDGNKRVATAAAITFLALNGLFLPAELDAGELYELTMAAATGCADKTVIASCFEVWLALERQSEQS